MPWVYLLRCADGTLYAGAAKDLERRLRLHLLGRASRYTRARLPVTLAWSRELPTWSDCLRQEHAIKRLSRAAKLALVAGSPPVQRARRRRRRASSRDQRRIRSTSSAEIPSDSRKS